MNNLKDREDIIKFALKLNSTNLSPLRSGNVSIRSTENNIEGFLLTPSGIKYETLKPEDVVFLSLKDKYDDLKMFNSGLNPSSEWRFHQDIYLKKKEVKAIVHAHSPHATAVSTHGKSIPAFHYMVALAGGNDIKCAEYATFGTTELSINIIKVLENRKACLMSNHGQLTVGTTIKQAFELAQEVENICHQYIIALKIGNPKILSSAEMNKILDKIKHYKKG
jgi:L-fuculose-phosphate aldolase